MYGWEICPREPHDYAGEPYSLVATLSLATQNQEARSYPSVSPIPGVSCLIRLQEIAYIARI